MGARRAAALAGLAALVASATGCRTVVDTVAGVFGPGAAGEAIDAHVVYRLRPDCPTLVARTTENGYTVLTPTELIDGGEFQQVPEFPGTRIETTGLFEGPVRTGEVVFRYIPPAESETWGASSLDVVATVEAVRLSLPEARTRLLAQCGPEAEGEVADDVPRTPGQ